MSQAGVSANRLELLQIADAVAREKAIDRDVRSGQLPVGTRLPTHRDLADELGVAVGTVTRAYAEAERRGLVRGTNSAGLSKESTSQKVL